MHKTASLEASCSQLNCSLYLLDMQLSKNRGVTCLVRRRKIWVSGMVGLTGLEPVTPALSRQCSNQLSYRPVAIWWRQAGSNR